MKNEPITKKKQQQTNKKDAVILCKPWRLSLILRVMFLFNQFICFKLYLSLVLLHIPEYNEINN